MKLGETASVCVRADTRWNDSGIDLVPGCDYSFIVPNGETWSDWTDESQTWRQGQLRPYPIAAYSPNIPWIAIRHTSKGWFADGVDLNGSGTSAATPQVAAAAALWLQRHRSEFSD